jgi:hypothetical protein
VTNWSSGVLLLIVDTWRELNVEELAIVDLREF